MTAPPLFRTGRRRIARDDRILPLINVVFLLLMFFMLAGRLAAGDPFAVQPPVSAGSDAESRAETTVLVGADGALALNGEPIRLDGLAVALAGHAAGAPVRVKADGEAEALAVVRVLDALRAAGIARLDLVTRAGGR